MIRDVYWYISLINFVSLCHVWGLTCGDTSRTFIRDTSGKFLVNGQFFSWIKQTSIGEKKIRFHFQHFFAFDTCINTCIGDTYGNLIRRAILCIMPSIGGQSSRFLLFYYRTPFLYKKKQLRCRMFFWTTEKLIQIERTIKNESFSKKEGKSRPTANQNPSGYECTVVPWPPR